jgi:hypothetical protein
MANKQITFASAHRARAKEFKNKTIRGTVIVGRFCNCLGLPPGVDPKKELDDLLGGNLQKWDLGLDLMRYPPFKTDELILQKSDVMNADTVGDLGDLVFEWYRQNGWTVE